MAKKNVEELYKGIFTIREKLQEVVQLASEIVTMSQAFGGEIPRVLTEQLSKYFIPEITKFIDDDKTPGAMTPLVTFLDSVPLAMTRQEPQPQSLPPFEASTEGLALPPNTEPAEGSYADMIDEVELEEDPTLMVEFKKWSPPVRNKEYLFLDEELAKGVGEIGGWFEETIDVRKNKILLPWEERVRTKIVFDSFRELRKCKRFINSLKESGADIHILNETKEEVKEEPPKKFAVYRKNLGGSTIGEQTNMKDFLLGVYACEDEANKIAEKLNWSITPDEKHFFKTEYYVKSFEPEVTKRSEGASEKVDYTK